MRDTIRRELVRWAIIGCGALLLAFAMSLTTRDVYSRAHIDARFVYIQREHKEDLRRIERELDYMRDDIRWIVRRLGGTPSDTD